MPSGFPPAVARAGVVQCGTGLVNTQEAAVVLQLFIQKGITVMGHHRGKAFVPGRMDGFRAVEGQSKAPEEEEKSEKLYLLPLLDHPSQRLKCIFS